MKLIQFQKYCGVTLFSLLTSCVHHQPVNSFEPQPLIEKSLRAKSAAIIFREPEVKDTYKTSSAGETFYYENVYNVLEEAFRKKLGSTFKTMDTIRGTNVNKAYDLVVYPNLTIDTVYDFWTYGCLIKFGVKVQNAKGDVLGQSQKEFKRSFQVSADKAFGIGMKEIFDPIVDAAFSTVR